jgi:hypothetical protein
LLSICDRTILKINHGNIDKKILLSYKLYLILNYKVYLATEYGSNSNQSSLEIVTWSIFVTLPEKWTQ